MDHIVALVNGGSHRESNLAPALRSEHRRKTAQDVAQKSKDYRVRAKHNGIKKPSRFPGSRDSKFKKRMDGSVVLR
jgi:5-methylcytosine-specific restriction endonuclease McrA